MRRNLRQRWVGFWSRLGARGNPRKTYDDLAMRYAEPHRVYHTLEHIAHCLDEFDRSWHLAVDHHAVELAIWYHDVVYDTRTKDNEGKSAVLASEMVRKASLPGTLGHAVTGLILATKHIVTPTGKDARLLVDIDLSILGQPEDKFDEYERQIRQEYSWVPEKEFISGRATILKSFLDRPAVYSTSFFRSEYESQARRNIARSLARLRA